MTFGGAGVAVRRAILVLGVGVLATLVGCASVRQRGERLLGSPDEGALLVIDCTLDATYDFEDREAEVTKVLQTGTFRFPGRDALDEIAIERMDAPGRYIYGTSFGGMVVFPHLAPGPYIIRSLGHRRFLVDHIKGTDFYFDRREFPFGGATGNRITFSVSSGKLGYVGGIDVAARYELRYDQDRNLVEFKESDDRTWKATVEYKADRERNVWSKLLRLSEGTRWTDVMTARLEELEHPTIYYDPTRP